MQRSKAWTCCRILRGEKDSSPHDALYWRFGQQMAIRQGDWKLVRYDPVVDGEKGRATDAKLYNLANDIGESHDLIDEEPEKAKALQAAWDKWNESNVPRYGAKAAARIRMQTKRKHDKRGGRPRAKASGQ